MHGRAGGYPRGKLKAVATEWARGRGGSGADDALSVAGRAEVEKIMARRRAAGGPAMAEIGPDEAEAVMLFFAMGTQWNWHPLGPRTGLRYEAIEPTARRIGVQDTPRLFDDLRIMEQAALAAWAKK